MEGFLSDTICALASAEGTAALGIIRVSGPEALDIAKKIFFPKQPREAPSLPQTWPSKQVLFGSIRDGEILIDEVLLHIAQAPASFTGEDTVEINCHGSLYIQQEILRILVREGARPALAGEFSQRAFLHGKMDLAQAEAVADLIASENEAAHRLALQQMRGGVSQEIASLRAELVDFASLLELELDFSEEDVNFADRCRLLGLLDAAVLRISGLCSSFQYGNALKNGVPVAIIGSTNAGKSTLLNALLGEERAIVSEQHGTTRDTIEESLSLEGIRFRFIDTAGLRDTIEEIEMLGIARSYEKIHSASLLLLLLDINRPEQFYQSLAKVLPEIDAKRQKLIVVFNKSEKYIENSDSCNNDVMISNNNVTNLYNINTSSYISAFLDSLAQQALPLQSVIAVSAKYRLGLDALKEVLVQSFREHMGHFAQGATLLTNIRHLHTLEEALAALDNVRRGLESDIPTDLVAQDLRLALYHLGSITGEIATDEILGNIFGKFCIGK